MPSKPLYVELTKDISHCIRATYEVLIPLVYGAVSEDLMRSIKNAIHESTIDATRHNAADLVFIYAEAGIDNIDP